MKKLVIKTLSLFLGLSPGKAFGKDQLTAEQSGDQCIKETKYRLRSDGKVYRYDFENGVMKHIKIIDPGSIKKVTREKIGGN